MWLEEMDFVEFFSQEITQIPSMQAYEKKIETCYVLV